MDVRRILIVVSAAVLPAIGSAAFAQADPSIDSMVDRMSRLEAETQTLRAELERVQGEAGRHSGVPASPVSTLAAEDDSEYYTWEQLQGEIKKNNWAKGDLKVVPYGYLWANMVYETARTVPTDRSYLGWVASFDDQGEDVFKLDGRNTRIGFDVAGPRLWQFSCAESGGKVEFDFQGDMVALENKGAVLLRHAYWEVKNDYYRLLFGQTWDVISPIYPNTTLYSIYWWGGNIGYRRPQLRLERYLHLSDTRLVTLQGSLNHDVVGIAAVSETGSWPVIEGRAAITLGYRGKNCHPWTFGMSGHIGNEGFFDVVGDDDRRRRTWSAGADLEMPLNDRTGFRGEFFYGENLETFLGGIGQGVNIGIPSLPTIYSTGGWLETYYFFTPSLHSHVGFGLDDPRDSDIVGMVGGRTYNQFYFGNILYDVTKKFRLGLEVASWKTLYIDRRPGESVRFEFMGQYGF
jgi:hypothetical protein